MKPPTNLSLDGIDNWVVHWRHKEIYQGCELVHKLGGVHPKLMNHRHTNHGHIEDEHNTDVWRAHVECLKLFLLEGDGQHRMQYEQVGEEDEPSPHPPKAEMTMNSPYMLLMLVSPQSRGISRDVSSRDGLAHWLYRRAGSSEEKAVGRPCRSCR